MKFPISVHSELPVRVKRYKLDPTKAEEFNSGQFARTNYTHLYILEIDREPMFIQVATPSFKQVLSSIKQLWNAYEGKPYDRHNHPVVMQAYDLEKKDISGAAKTLEQRKAEKAKFNQALRRNKKRVA